MLRFYESVSRATVVHASFFVATACLMVGCATARPGGDTMGKAGAAIPTSAGDRDAQLGRAALNRGQFAAAAGSLQRAADLDHAAAERGPEADALTDLATACEMLGQFDAAKEQLDGAVAISRALGDSRREFAALNSLGAVCTMKPDSAAPGPSGASTTSPATTQSAMPAGHVHGSGKVHDAQAILDRALTLASESGDRDARASVHDNLGNFCSDRMQFDLALEHYQQCARLAEAAGDPVRAALGQANAGACALTASESADAKAERARRSTRQSVRDTEDDLRQQAAAQRLAAIDWDGKALPAVSTLPPSHAKATLLNLLGQTDERIAKDMLAQPGDAAALAANAPAAATRPASLDPSSLTARARRAYRQAVDVAAAIDDQRSLSYACGYLGHLDEMAADADVKQPAQRQRDLVEAMELSRRAVFAAQRAQSGESLYRWEWQVGRLLVARGDLSGAIDACRRAVQSVKPVRGDIALGYGNQRARTNFREDVAKLYFDLADLLLREVDTPHNPAAPVQAAFAQRGGAASPASDSDSQKILVEARDTVELLKSAEWEDYLRDECVQTFHTAQQGIQKIEPTTAVVYVVPLPDRIELLVQFGDHLRRYVTPIGAEDLSDTTLQFRQLLPYIASSEYRDPGEKLYHWLIDPIRPDLSAEKIDTLIFIPDGVLRTIPMAALVDPATGEFLIDQYAVGVVPSLGLTAEGPGRSGRGAAGTARPNLPLSVNGLSKAVGSFPALPFVSTEVQNVKGEFPDRQVDTLFNDNFVVSRLKEEFSSEQPAVVHIASHGQFGAESKDTFIVTYEASNPLTFNGLEQLVKVNNFKGRRPVGLLVLSACQTAAGDDRAALGLGGVAVKSGARSAVATLWSVNDESSTQLISSFYRQLHDHPDLSMAKCLRAAQLEMIHHPSKLAYQHPYFWAPYLMIGNWR